MYQLPEILGALTEELEQIRDGDFAAGPFNSSRLDRTEDDDFIYVEAPLSCMSDSEIDISIQQARAFIRIERSLKRPHSGDEVETESNAIFGWVEFAESGALFRAALSTGGSWDCTAAPAVARLLNDEYSPCSESADLASWCDVLIKAANRLDGLAWLVPGTLSEEW
jgi:hypothetical protein